MPKQTFTPRLGAAEGETLEAVRQAAANLLAAEAALDCARRDLNEAASHPAPEDGFPEAICSALGAIKARHGSDSACRRLGAAALTGLLAFPCARQGAESMPLASARHHRPPASSGFTRG